MKLITWLKHWLETDDTKVLYFLMVILIANLTDFTIGWVNAKFNSDVKFSSARAIWGIARKMVMFILLILFIPFVLLMPDGVGITALYILYTGYLVSEFTSILNHLKIGSDDKTVNLFRQFIENISGGMKNEN